MLHHEKTPLASKKFLAYLLGEFGWKALVAAEIYADANWGITLATILIAGFLEIGYILGQSGLDMFVRGGSIAAAAIASIWGKPTDDKESP